MSNINTDRHWTSKWEREGMNRWEKSELKREILSTWVRGWVNKQVSVCIHLSEQVFEFKPKRVKEWMSEEKLKEQTNYCLRKLTN